MPTSKTTAKAVSANKRPARKSTSAEQMSNSKFHELFMEEIKDIYWAEKNLVKALPRMQKAATSEELKNAIGNHLEETKTHVTRLEEIFEMMGKRAQGKKCDAMEGLISEAQQCIEDTDEDSMVRDAGIIICAQKVEHYEIAAYGSLRTLATVMGHTEAADLLEQTLEEEKHADSLLTEIAESTVNEEAAAE
ncbi:ferritin-like domain-containing protein [Chitinophaga qingshengii]|uniref:Ferritin-like domain-containing protein n=1 Tax=Chitinophaga qingshengii TaxID=1569794 RepID=A0ABR7TVM4_9BACT|nr:ferritin-like domain-containing protein [Chitinophaga qingshengii]MBC9933700.1 ferritin-like domain-containing protein [Chitinophaga qingshengii]